MAQQTEATDATLTEYHRATTNPEGNEDAEITFAKDGRGLWVPDRYETLEEPPTPPTEVGETAHNYYAECSCGETFGNWGQATKHAEEEH